MKLIIIRPQHPFPRQVRDKFFGTSGKKDCLPLVPSVAIRAKSRDVVGIISATCLLFFYLNLHSVTNQEHFLAGNQLYQQAQFQAALVEYQAINPKNSVVWYNLGNSAYHLEQYLDASLFWKRAQLLELKTFGYVTNLAKISAQNILQAQAKLITAGFKPTLKFTTELNKLNSNSNQSSSNYSFNHSKLTVLKINKFNSFYNFIKLKIQQVLIQIPLIFWQLLLLLGLVLWCWVGIGMFQLSPFSLDYTRGERAEKQFPARSEEFIPSTTREGMLRARTILLFFLNLILAASLYFKYNFSLQEWAIVNQPNLVLQIGPGANYPAVGHLRLAEFVKILGQNSQSWYAVQSEDGLQVGWTAADGLTKC